MGTQGIYRVLETPQYSYFMKSSSLQGGDRELTLSPFQGNGAN